MSASRSHVSASWTIWLLAAISALALHAGALAFTILDFRLAEEDDSGGAPAIEIGMEPMAARAVQTELPPGMEADASVAAPEVTEQQATEVETNLPQDVPTESDEPDRVVALEASKDEVTEEAPETVTVNSVPSEQSVVSEAAAPPPVETITESQTTVAVTPDIGRGARRVIASWQKQLVTHLDRHKRYPESRSGKAAKIIVAFAMDRTGRLLSASVVQGSGDQAFDDAALAMLRRSDPLPAPPPLVADEGLSFTVPVVFRVNR